jgi:preprotein translocase subunit YajC
MSTIVTWIAGIYAAGFIVVLILIVFLIIRRRKQKDKEDFEKRDN